MSGQEHGSGHVHVVPLKIYFVIITTLGLLTAATVLTAKIDMGAMNTVVALTIAVIKGTLVVLYFMHVRWSKRLVWVFVAAAFVWFMILIAFTMQDFVSRGWI
jgi:cytochrome c oxidase subunit 4